MNKKTEIFLEAVEQDNIFLVKRLLRDSDVDPAAKNNYSIRWAAENGHTEIIKLLLADPRVDPAADNNYAIRIAAENGHAEVVKLLLADPRVKKHILASKGKKT